MTDLGDASGAALSSHETSASPPPAKRTRSNKGKTPTPISGSPAATRAGTRRKAAAAAASAAASSATSVAGDVHPSASFSIPDADSAPLMKHSRAGSEISAMAPMVNSKKRKADQLESGPSAIDLDRVAAALADQASDDEDEAEPAPEATVASPDDSKPQDLDNEQEPAVTRRGRPPGRGRGGGRARGGRGGAKTTLTRQNSGLPEPAKRGGRGGRGRKTSGNLQVQIAYDRQSHLRQNFKEVAKIVRYGLDLLAEKSLEVIQEDAEAFKRNAEYAKVMFDLDAQRNSTIASQGRKYDMKVALVNKRREMEDEYSKLQFQFHIQDLQEKYELRCKAAILDEIRRSKPIVDPHGSVSPDEQSNFRLLPEEKFDLTDNEAIGGAPLEANAGPSRRGKKNSPKKRSAKESGPAELAAKRPSLLSASAPPPEAPDEGDVFTESNLGPILEDGSSAESQQKTQEGNKTVISFPKYVRRGRAAEPNNRIVVQPHFEYDNDEIGLRSTEREAEGRKAQPEKFFLDDAGSGYRVSGHSEADFDPMLIARYGLHPKYGLPIPGASNPDDVVPGTDFTKALARTNPIVFVTHDGKKTLETSRSAAYVHTEEDWATFVKLMDMKKALGSYDVRDLFNANGIATYDAVAREVGEIEDAVDELLVAAKDLEEAHLFVMPSNPHALNGLSGGRDVRGPSLANTSRPPVSYDGVKEIVRDTFSKSLGPPVGPLAALADAAEILSRETSVRSTAPAKFVQQNIAQATTYIPFSHQRSRNNSTSSRVQTSPQKTKFPSAPPPASPQTMAPPKLALQKIPSQPIPPQPISSQPIPPQSISSQSMPSQPMPSQPLQSQQMPFQPTSSQSKSSQPRVTQSKLSQPKISQPKLPQAKALQSKAIQSKTAQPLASQTMAPHMVPQMMGPVPMAPPAVASQMMAHPVPPPPPPMGPPGPSTGNIKSPVVGQGMGPPPVLPQPASSAFSRGRSGLGQGPGQMLPPPTPSQHYYGAAHRGQQQQQPPQQSQHQQPQHQHQQQQQQQSQPQQQQVQPHQQQQQQHQHQHQQQHTHPHQQQQQQQQHPQQQPQSQSQSQPQQQPQQQQQQVQQHQQQYQQQFSPAPRSSRAAPPSSGLRDLLPRPDRGGNQPRQGQLHHQPYYDNAAGPPPYPGAGGGPHVDRGYAYGPREPQVQTQSQQFQVQAPSPNQQFQQVAQVQLSQPHLNQQHAPQHHPIQQGQGQSPVQQYQQPVHHHPNQRHGSHSLPSPQHPPQPLPPPQHPSQHISPAPPGPQHPSQHLSSAPPGLQHPSQHLSTAPPGPQHPPQHLSPAPPGPQHPPQHLSPAPPGPQHPSQHISPAPPGPQHPSQHLSTAPPGPQHPGQHLNPHPGQQLPNQHHQQQYGPPLPPSQQPQPRRVYGPYGYPDV